MYRNDSSELSVKPNRILFVDDHPATVFGVISYLKDHPNIKIAGHAGNACKALEMIEELQPDIVMTNIEMPGKDGIELAKEVQSRFPWIKVIIFSSSMDDYHITDAIDAGIMGYLLKTDELCEIQPGIEKVMKGERYFSAAVATRVVELLQRTETNPIKRQQKIQHTDKEVAVMNGICNGLSAKEISCELNMEERQVTAIKERLFKKLGFRCTLRLAMYAVRAYIVNPWKMGVGCLFYVSLVFNCCL